MFLLLEVQENGFLFKHIPSFVPSRCFTSAFTLLETIIALGVLATAIMGLLIALNTSIDAAKSLQQEMTVRHELENRLARLQIDRRKEFHQKSPPNKMGVTYTEEIFPEKITKPDRTVLEGYRRIRVTAKWGNPIQEREASFLMFSL